MGLIDDKEGIFTTIGAYTSMMQEGTMPNNTNIFPSVNNKKDVVPFLLDVMKVVAGSDASQELTGQLFTNFATKTEPVLKKAVENQAVQANSGDQLPSNFGTAGYDIDLGDIDINQKYQNAVDSPIGMLSYNTTKPNFDTAARQAVVLNGTPVEFGGINMTYNGTTNKMNFKPKNPALTIGDFLSAFVASMVIIDQKTFMTSVMNGIYGTTSHAQGKTVEQIANELAVSTLIDQAINDDDTFELMPDSYDAILQRAQQIAAGTVYYDMGCGVIGATLSMSGLTGLIEGISGSTNPFLVGNKVADTVSGSTQNTPETSAENIQTMKDGFFQKLIKIITNTLAQAVTTTPQIRTLLAIISGFQNQGQVLIGKAKDDLKKFKVYLKCIIKTAMEMINKFIFDLILVLLIKLLQPVIKRIIKEQINLHVKQIKSLAAVT